MNLYSTEKYRNDLIISSVLMMIGIAIIYNAVRLQIDIVAGSEYDPMTARIKDSNSKELFTAFWMAGIFWFVAIRKFIRGQNNKEKVKEIITNINSKINTADKFKIGKSGEAIDVLYQADYKDIFTFHEEIAASKGRRDIDDLGEYLIEYYKDSVLGFSENLDLGQMKESPRYIMYIVYNKFQES